MSDPDAQREGQPIESGADLKLSTRGIIERLKGGKQVPSHIMARLLQQLVDAPADGEATGRMEQRAPEALARCRLALLRLLQEDEHHRDRHDLSLRKLALEVGDDALLGEQDAVALVHTPDCALRHGGDLCDCTPAAAEES